MAAALSVCIEQLALHTRRGKVGELWQLLLAEVDARLDRLAAAQQAQKGGAVAAGQAPASGKKGGRKRGKDAGAGADAAGTAAAVVDEGELAAATSSAARIVALLAQLVEHGRGCRVESYAPLFQLAARLVKPEILGSSGSSSGEAQAAAMAEGEEAAPPGLAPLPRGASAVYSDFLNPSMSAQVLRLMLALAQAHAKVAGASEGPAAIGKAAPQWAPAFARAPPAQVLPFIRGLITFPAGYDVARFFGQQMLGALGRCLLAGEHCHVLLSAEEEHCRGCVVGGWMSSLGPTGMLPGALPRVLS